MEVMALVIRERDRSAPHKASLGPSKLIGATLLALASVRCATIKHGTTQPILVESDPTGAAVSLKCDKDSIPNLGSTPTTIQVSRKSKSCAIGIQKDGYVPANVLLHRTISGAYAGNLVLGGAVGLVADAADGAMYDQEPKAVRVKLEELDRQPITTLPAPVPQNRRMLQDRSGRDVAWMADQESDVASCKQIGSYDANGVSSEGRAAIADEVVRVGGDTLFNPNGGALFGIYRCGPEPGIAVKSP